MSQKYILSSFRITSALYPLQLSTYILNICIECMYTACKHTCYTYAPLSENVEHENSSCNMHVHCSIICIICIICSAYAFAAANKRFLCSSYISFICNSPQTSCGGLIRLWSPSLWRGGEKKPTHFADCYSAYERNAYRRAANGPTQEQRAWWRA